MRAQHLILLAKQNMVQSQIHNVLNKVMGQHQKLDDLDDMITRNDLFKGDDEVIESQV